MAFTNKDSIKNRIASKVHSATNSGIYALTCKKESCEKIYVGQSHNIPKRLEDHTNAKRRASMRYYTSVKHTFGGHELEPSYARVPYKSNSLSHRLVIETCLISLCKTVIGNKASSDNRDMNILAPIVLKSSPIDWRVLSEIQPSFNPELAPRIYRKFFSTHNNEPNSSENLLSNEGISPNVTRASPSLHTVVNISTSNTSPEVIPTHSYFTRSKVTT